MDTDTSIFMNRGSLKTNDQSSTTTHEDIGFNK
jgi:hypothetical protein